MVRAFFIHLGALNGQFPVMKILLSLALLLAAALPLSAGGKRGDDAGIAFHIETSANDNPKMIFQQLVDGQQRAFRLVPEVGTRDIASFNPFPSQDGQGYGLLLKLKPGVHNRLAAITATNIDKWMVARVNGRIVDGVLIDQQINDGELVIWKGVALAEIQALDKKLPRVGEKKPRG